mmetsp:Transcript_53739/g.158158  ORF Transcript_53739/g.158158 Transcript_53739/m.158158 type:complete len:275 (-) Transcript_53739:998-1822(-)
MRSCERATWAREGVMRGWMNLRDCVTRRRETKDRGSVRAGRHARLLLVRPLLQKGLPARKMGHRVAASARTEARVALTNRHAGYRGWHDGGKGCVCLAGCLVARRPSTNLPRARAAERHQDHQRAAEGAAGQPHGQLCDHHRGCLRILHREAPRVQDAALRSRLLPRSHPGAAEVRAHRVEHPLRVDGLRLQRLQGAGEHVPHLPAERAVDHPPVHHRRGELRRPGDGQEGQGAHRLPRQALHLRGRGGQGPRLQVLAGGPLLLPSRPVAGRLH